jgi:glycolate oxidase FAD binding subunit
VATDAWVRQTAAVVLDAFQAARAQGVWCRVRGQGSRSRAWPGTLAVDSGPWTDLLWHRPEDLTVEAAAGMTVAALNELLRPAGRWFPVGLPDGDHDTLGGLVGAGLSGLWSGYGPVRDRILGLRAVTPGFGPVTLGAAVVKSVAGYPMPRLYWGTGGTFGVILSLTLKVAPLPRGGWPQHRAAPVAPEEWPALAGPVRQLLDDGWPAG